METCRNGRIDAAKRTEGTGMGVAARKQAEMGLRMQRSGRRTAMVGVAVWKHVETDGLMQRGKREGSEIGFAARRHTETALRMQRSGQERIVVGFAERGHAVTGGRNQGRRCPGPAKRTERRWDTPRCTETG